MSKIKKTTTTTTKANEKGATAAPIKIPDATTSQPEAEMTEAEMEEQIQQHIELQGDIMRGK
jgi:hypothetical protein